MSKKGFTIVLILALLCSMLFISYKDSSSASTDNAEADLGTLSDMRDNQIVVWYADDALTEYLTAAALSYQSENDIKVVLQSVSGVDYLEQINTASIHSGEQNGNDIYRAPDVYITTHDNLMRAYLAGLADKVTDPHESLVISHYPQTALSAISYDGDYVAYPMYYETNYFLYNKTYMQNLATERIEAEGGIVGQNTEKNVVEENPEEEKKDEENHDEENSDEENSDEENPEEISADEDPMGDEDLTVSPEVLKRLSTIIPSTIDDIKDFANYYDAPEAVEAVFKWDVSDIFYNYFFIGNYVSIGGDNGDNGMLFNVYNDQAVEALKVYQGLNNFFSIDAKEVTYDKILQEFIDGKTVFTVATTDAVSRIAEAKREGKFNFEYGISVLPDVSRTLKSRGLSVTTAAVVNGYSENKEAANDFASYISYEKGQELYRLAGKISCKRECVYENNEIYNIMNEYEKSVPLPKMIDTQDYWVRLEIAFTDIWNGADPDETLKNLSDTLASQVGETEYHIPFQESFGVDYNTPVGN